MSYFYSSEWLQREAKSTMKQSLIPSDILLLTGCVNVSGSDIACTDRLIDLGSSEDKTLLKVDTRGLCESTITPASKAVFNYEAEKFDHRPLKL